MLLNICICCWYKTRVIVAQVLAFDLLDELAPQTGEPGKEWTLVDVDLDEAKGWYIHGTNGTVVPTKDEFVHVLATLQMILIRCVASLYLPLRLESPSYIFWCRCVQDGLLSLNFHQKQQQLR
jgi:hypothetical protein